MTEKEAGQLLLDYVEWADDETASPNDCPFDAKEVFEAMKMGGNYLLQNKMTWEDIRMIGKLWVESPIEYGEDGRDLSESILKQLRPKPTKLNPQIEGISQEIWCNLIT